MPNLTADDRLALRQGRAMGELVRTEGWKVLEEVLTTQLANKRQELEKIDLPHHEAQVVKGAILSLKLVLAMPRAMIDAVATVKASEQEKEDVD